MQKHIREVVRYGILPTRILAWWEAGEKQDHFFFTCPHCGKMTELIYPDCLVITADNPTDAKIICKECKGKLDHPNGEWIPLTPVASNR